MLLGTSSVCNYVWREYSKRQLIVTRFSMCRRDKKENMRSGCPLPLPQPSSTHAHVCRLEFESNAPNDSQTQCSRNHKKALHVVIHSIPSYPIFRQFGHTFAFLTPTLPQMVLCALREVFLATASPPPRVSCIVPYLHSRSPSSINVRWTPPSLSDLRTGAPLSLLNVRTYHHCCETP